jgi:hypothetical protein
VRADEAAMRTGQRGGRPVAGAVLADELDPYAEDDELELVDP